MQSKLIMNETADTMCEWSYLSILGSEIKAGLDLKWK